LQKKLKTLDRALSKAGLGSRTEARSWIGAGRVKVNGRTVQTPDHWVDLGRDKIALDGKPIRQSEKMYLLLYKPKGYLTTYKDPEGRPTVYDLMPDLKSWVFPVGRLDLDSSGLLVMTNDTALAEQLSNPDYKVPKTYLVKCATLLSDDQLERLRQGVVLSDGPTRPAVVQRIRDAGKHSFLEITISEGRNRQVRRMLEAIDSKVLKLVRTAIGPLRIADLAIGKYRPLAPAEVNSLRSRRTTPGRAIARAAEALVSSVGCKESAQ
jgi:23S rRNA pseudouridine2605 synthase